VADRDWQPTPWTLRPYQVEGLRAISQAWKDGHQRTMLVLATGLGKTTVFAEVARRRALNDRRGTLVLAHRIELVEQAATRLRAAGLRVAIESGDREAYPYSLEDADCVVATVQTLKGKRLKKWPADYFDTVICDEAHHAASASYRAILDRFEYAQHLGVTATPDRGDQIAIGHVYPHLAYEYGIRAGIESGFLAPLRSLAIDTPSVDLSSVRTTKQEHGRDLSADDLAAAMKGEAQLHELAGPIAREAGDRQTLIFTPSVEIAHALADVLAAYVGADKVRSLDGGSDKQTRADVLASYQRGDVRYLLNCALFTEGFDAPSTSCIAIARPTKSRALYAQMVGRGTRLAEGKADCLILNLAPSNCSHELVSPTDLFDGIDLPEDIAGDAQAAIARGEPVLQVLSRAEEIAKEREAQRERDRQRSRMVADVRYRRREIDPFGELDLDVTEGDRRGPRATERQADVLAKAGFGDAAALSRKEAGKLLDELTRRRQRGLCTIKQMRALKRAGLRGDLSFDDARAALDALASNSWRISPDMAAKWGDAA
jgi:superfamily II DNA or RNA helicase